MRARMVALVSVSALALAGCGGDDEPEETSSSTVSPRVPSSNGSSSAASSSSSSGSANSSGDVSAEPPAEAQENTQAGAEAFAEWYWQQQGEALTTGDGAALRSAASESCDACEASAEELESNAADYGLARKNPYEITAQPARRDGESYLASVRVRYDDYQLYSEDGTAAAQIRADSFRSVLTLERGDALGWQVVQSTLIQGEQ